MPDTLKLATKAARRAGITRVSDVTAFGVPGISVFQATRPAARSLTVSQGKGLTASAAIVGALLESVELWSAENLAEPDARRPLTDLSDSEITAWSGSRDEQAIDLDPNLARAWLPGEDLFSGRPCAIPWDLLSLDDTRGKLEYPATSVGLACGNSRPEALVSGVAELLEHHSEALFARLSPREKLAAQIVPATIDDPLIQHLLRWVEGAGFMIKAWSMASEAGFAAIFCGLFRREASVDAIAPAAGTGCHPSARVAFLRALLEAVQSRAGLVAGARDDVTEEEYGTGAEREAAVVFGALAFGDGMLDWRRVPTADCPSSEDCLDFLLAKASEQTGLPLVAFDHEAPWAGLHLAHVIAPGLLDGDRRRREVAGGPPAAATPVRWDRSTSASRKLLFGGPSIAGLGIPADIEVRPPARCGDLAALLDDPPGAVGLVDGYFKLAPTVWHKEIMSLLAVGTRVVGGASLGALRAAELERFGMEGVGAIFDGYRSGMLVRDDAVMLVHAPAEIGYAPLSLPLVDAEYALWLAELPVRARRTMQRIVRRASFATRNWADCLAEYRRRVGEDFPLSADALEAAPSLKRRDATLVIAALAVGRAAGSAARRPAPPVTGHYRALLSRRVPAFAAGLAGTAPAAPRN